LALVRETAKHFPVKLFYMTVSGNTLVGAANESGQIKLYAVDLNSGQMRQIGVSNPGVGTIRASERYVVWDRDEAEVFVYDSQANKETLVAPGRYPDVSGNIVVWIDTRNARPDDPSDIYGYDLSLRKEFPIVVRSGRQTQPKIAGQWVAYLDIVGDEDYRLRVHHLKTDEDFEIGTVPVFKPPSALVAAEYFALSSNRLAWISAQDIHTVHIYDLDARTDRALLKSETAFHNVLLDGDILLGDGGRIGYDLSRNVSFSVPHATGEWLGAGGSPILLSRNRLVWAMTKDGEEVQHLFTAQIVWDK
jgi:hypothetical protein